MRLGLAFSVIFSTLFIDLLSKWLIKTHIVPPLRVIPLTSFFNLVLGYNRGMSFGLFDSNNLYAPFALSAVAIVIIIVLSTALWRSNSLQHRLGFAAIIGGALGNVVDCLHDGAVTDILDFYVGEYHWPAFNFADAFIFCGVIALFIPYARESTARP